MKYFIIEDSGLKIGPYDVNILEAWSKDGRIFSETILVEENTEETLTAGHIFPNCATEPLKATKTRKSLGYEPYEAPPIIENFVEINKAWIPNDSGTGKNAVFPKELKGLNWGGFLLPVIWGICHKLVIGYILAGILIIFTIGEHFVNEDIVLKIKIANAVIFFLLMILFLINGNKLAWKHRKFQNHEEFKEIQSIWTKWGIWTNVIYIALVLIF